MSLYRRPPSFQSVIFRRKFTIDRPLHEAVLRIWTFRKSEVYLDGQELHPDLQPTSWKDPVIIDITAFITQGQHEVRIHATNYNAPVAVLAYVHGLDVGTGPNWEASLDEIEWVNAIPADQVQYPDISRRFPSPSAALLSRLTIYSAVFLGVFCLTILLHRKNHSSRNIVARINASWLRWILLLAWMVLACNNILKIPETIGFDTRGHIEYILYVVRQRQAPLATEGWQMFQSPLYYYLSAPLYSWFSTFYDIGTVIKLLRIIPLLCGGIQIQLCYMAVRSVFPNRNDLQCLGMLVGGLVPMNLYISQGIGNEPTAGLFSSAALVASFAMLKRGGWEHVRKVAFVTGFFLGLALLTKVSAILLVFPILLFFILCMKSSSLAPFSKTKAIAIYLLTISILSGWYYFRNYIKLGRVFIGGWDQSRTIVWWQDPGYRTIGQLTRFGDSLRQPIYSACVGFWDGLYSTFWADGYLSSIVRYESRPPWDYDFMLSGILLSLVPMIGILLGVVSIATGRSREERLPLLLATLCTLIFVVAMLYIFVTVPIYSTVKASYTLGLLVCYAILGAAGFDLLLRGRIMRALVYGLLGCWGFSSYLSYFVR